MEKINNSVNLNLSCDQNLQIMPLGNILIFLLTNHNNKDIKLGKTTVTHKITSFFWGWGLMNFNTAITCCHTLEHF